MNTLEKFLTAIGLSSERFEKMSEAEQANLRQISDNQATLSQERDTAVQDRDAAQTRITELEGELATAQETATGLQDSLTEAESNLETANARITELEGQVTDLEAKLEKKPSAASTTVVADSAEGENTPKKKTADEKPKYLTSADQELAEFHAKFNRK